MLIPTIEWLGRRGFATVAGYILRDLVRVQVAVDLERTSNTIRTST